MSNPYALPRVSLLTLLFAQLLVILPHAPRLPSWILVVWVASAAWRMGVFSGRLSYPDWRLKSLLALCSVVGLFLGYGTLIGLDPAVGLLIIAFSLKLLEMYKLRDVLIVVYLAYFLAAIEFLYDRSILMAIYIIAVFVLIASSQIALNQSSQSLSPVKALRMAAKMLLQALPIMLVLFLLFPRIGPLWNVPLSQNASRTGMSDTMSPGDIANLSRSDELAFRATFNSAIPLQSELYWRGIVLDYFDGRTWHRSAKQSRDRSRAWQDGRSQPEWATDMANWQQETSSYSIIMEPTYRRWLYSLDVGRPGDGYVLSPQRTLVATKPIGRQFVYTQKSYASKAVALDLYEQRNLLQLPAGYNPRARLLAQQWAAEVGTGTAFLRRIQEYFRQGYTYTLSPAKLSQHSVDDLLFRTREGFCEHYAGATVFLLRAAGIPARVVAGYQGGEKNPFEDYLLVKQYDAHAWVEAWLPQLGWIPFDPTSAVAPNRLTDGLRQALESQGTSEASALSLLSNAQWINFINMRIDSLNYLWTRFVLGYDSGLQLQVMKGLLGEVSAWRIAAALLTVAGLVIIWVSWSLWRPQPITSQQRADRLYRRFCRRLQVVGLQRQPGEVPSQFARRVERARPDLAAAVAEITDCYQRQIYQVESSPAHPPTSAQAANQTPSQTPQQVQRQAQDQLAALIRAFRPRKRAARSKT